MPVCNVFIFTERKSILPIGVMVKDIAVRAVGLGSITGPVKFDSVAIGLPPVRRFIVDQSLSRREGPRHSQYASE